MGLFKKKTRSLELDLPPPPPPEEDLPPMPAVEEEMGLPPTPYPAPMNTKIKPSQDMELPPVPEDLDMSLPPEPEFGLHSLRDFDKEQLPKLEFPEIEQEEEIQRFAANAIEENELDNRNEFRQKMLRKGDAFVNVSRYKDMTGYIDMIKTKIKESEGCVERLNEIKNQKDKYFEQFRSKLEDLQRKSSYVDKSLFEVKTI